MSELVNLPRTEARRRAALRLGVAGLGATLLAGTTLPALAQEGRSPPVSVSVERSLPFTPAGADPRLAAAFASRGESAGDFRFTPAPANARPAQVRIAVSGSSSNAEPRSANRRLAENSVGDRAQLTPSSYNLDVDVGWKRFAVSGEVAQSKSGDPILPDREGARLGVRYDISDSVSADARVSTDRETRRIAPSITPVESYALDVGGAVKVTRNIALTGGVRYRVDMERLPEDPARQESQAVYVGGKLKF